MSSERQKHIDKLMERAAAQRKAEAAAPSRNKISGARRAPSAPSQSKHSGQQSGSSSSRSSVAAKPVTGSNAERASKPSPVQKSAPSSKPSTSSKSSDAPETKPQSRVAQGRSAQTRGAGYSAASSSSGSETKPIRQRGADASSRTSAATKAAREAVAQDQPVNNDKYIWLSLAMIFVGGYLLLSCVSYLSYWQQDQSVASWGMLLDMSNYETLNWGGRIGAILSQEIVGNLFGLAGLLLPLTFLFGAVKVLPLKKKRLRKSIRSTVIMMLIASVTLGQVFGADDAVFGSGYGGQMGIYISRWLSMVIGPYGSSFLVVIVFLATLYFVNSEWVKASLGRMIESWRRREEFVRARREAKMERFKLDSAEAALRTRLVQNELRRNQPLVVNTPSPQDESTAESSDAAITASSCVADAPVDQDETSVMPNNLRPQISSLHEELLTSQECSMGEDANALARAHAVIDPMTPIAPIAPLADGLVELDNGQYGYIYDYNEYGDPFYYYYIVDSYDDIVASEPIEHAPAEAEALQVPIAQTENPRQRQQPGDHVEFIIRTRQVEPEYESESPYTSGDEPFLTSISASVQDEIGYATSQTIGEQYVTGPVVVGTQSAAQYASQPELSTVAAATSIESRVDKIDTARAETESAAESELTLVSGPSAGAQAVATTTKIVHFAPSKDDPNFIVEQQISEHEIDDDTINLSALYDPTLELRNYQKPPVELLRDHSRRVTVTEEELLENKNRIVSTLGNFGILIDTIEATVGPTVTLYEIVPAPGVRISKIKNLEEDIALSLAALGIRIIAPIPGKGTIGIEVPNKNKEIVSMYSVIKSVKFHESKYDLPIALGKTIQNETFVVDLAKMPHLLVAGATGQGKSVGLNAIITSLLYKKHPAEIKFILVDPKKVELTLYSRIEKHFLAKLPDEEKAIITDTQKVIHTLNSLCIEMSDRYDLLEAAKVRHIKEYNEKFINRRLNPEKGHRYLPYFIVIIDEFADLIMTAGREIETPIARIAQLARAVGIHLIIATQRPSVSVITGIIKANFPARIAFRVATAIDSRTILDASGAKQLIGQGDMLVSTGSDITRVQCAFIDTPEVELITNHIGNQKGYLSAYELPEYVPEGEASSMQSSDDTVKRDSLFDEVARYVVSNQSGSASTIQRKFSIGFNRAGRIVDQLEAAGIVGRNEGSKPRQVLISDMVSLEFMLDRH